MVLLDTTTGIVVSSGPEASAKLDVVVLEGDFNKEDDDDWTEEEFEGHAVKEREGKRPLLTGELSVMITKLLSFYIICKMMVLTNFILILKSSQHQLLEFFY